MVKRAIHVRYDILVRLLVVKEEIYKVLASHHAFIMIVFTVCLSLVNSISTEIMVFLFNINFTRARKRDAPTVTQPIDIHQIFLVALSIQAPAARPVESVATSIVVGTVGFVEAARAVLVGVCCCVHIHYVFVALAVVMLQKLFHTACFLLVKALICCDFHG